MPDHLHLLVEGTGIGSDLLLFVWDFKRRTGFSFKRAAGEFLWQEGFCDRILRSDECVIAAARYLLGNPIRAGLVRHPLEWPFMGSERYELRDLLESVRRTRV